MKKTLLALLLLALLSPASAHAFCGFYVAKADSKLFNQASKVVLAYNKGRAVITMANDFQGDAKDFAIVIPVPTSIAREQIHVTNNALIDQLDSYSAPRLVEYFDENPCMRKRYEGMMMMKSAAPASSAADSASRAKALGVKIEAQYTVGEYDIAILSAEQSSGLQTYLNENGYKLPAGAERILGSYIRQQMRFFVAKVNLDEQAKLGYSYLRPLQVAYNSPKFMLPIRLGTLNAPPVEDLSNKKPGATVLNSRPDRSSPQVANEAIYNDGSQDVILMVLTRNGRVEATNYRNVKIDNDKDVPLFIKDDFARFYRDMFRRRAKAEGSAVFLEYAWDMGWCDPCAADPLRPDQLKELGVFWLDEPAQDTGQMPNTNPNANNLIGGSMLPNGIAPRGPQMAPAPRPFAPPGAVNTFITRLHARYNAQTFPEDLMLQETSDRENFQGRFILRHPWDPGKNPSAENSCEEAKMYLQSLPTRYAHEAETLARLTGWSINDIRAKMAANGQSVDNTPTPVEGKEWWKGMWENK